MTKIIELTRYKDKNYEEIKEALFKEFEYHLNLANAMFYTLNKHINENKITDAIDFTEFKTYYTEFDIHTITKVVEKKEECEVKK